MFKKRDALAKLLFCQNLNLLLFSRPRCRRCRRCLSSLMVASPPTVSLEQKQKATQPRSQGSLLPVGRVGENPGNEVVGHLRVPKTLTFKMRLSGQPFM